MSSAQLRRELTARALKSGQPFEATYGRDDLHVPSLIFREEDGLHGNFHLASYRRICANPEWRKRLDKVYTASSRVAWSNARQRKELDCAGSSDALLMNVFCYPGVLKRPRLLALLGLEAGATPAFGYRPEPPLRSGHRERTEVDLRLGHLLIEAKLTESGFQSARPALVERYQQFEEVFRAEDLPRNGRGDYLHYQLIRGVLAAHHTGHSYMVLCDARRPDLRENWFRILQAVASAELRCRLGFLSWQELALTLPSGLQSYLRDKYGIGS